MMNDDDIERRAVEEILREAARGKERAKDCGAVGWTRPKYVTNKRFLRNTVVSAIKSHGVKRSIRQQKPNVVSSGCVTTQSDSPSIELESPDVKRKCTDPAIPST